MSGYLPRKRFQALLDVLHRDGYETVGPKVQDGAIVFGPLTRAHELPAGWQDRQAPGSYRLERGDSARLFAWANGPQALKPLTFASREVLWSVRRGENGELKFVEEVPEPRPTAVIGVRGCDLAALVLQDQHFCYREYNDHYYNARRRSLLLVAVDCSHPADTCFCHSTGDGPAASATFDIALTELEDGYLVRARSERGRGIVEDLGLEPETDAHREAAAAQHEAAVAAQTRGLPDHDLRDGLMAALEHPQWDDVAGRCLSCGNCTSVCPTCFCHTEGDHTDLAGRSSEHYRQWDSCFTRGHSYMHGFVVRDDTRLRYRQWLLHKLALWHDQYGRSGCVGCGRCIAWCPVGIDITAEAHALLEPPHAQS
jgi:ferredoxin